MENLCLLYGCSLKFHTRTDTLPVTFSLWRVDSISKSPILIVAVANSNSSQWSSYSGLSACLSTCSPSLTSVMNVVKSLRSAERRGGKECRVGWWADHEE